MSQKGKQAWSNLETRTPMRNKCLPANSVLAWLSSLSWLVAISQGEIEGSQDSNLPLMMTVTCFSAVFASPAGRP